MPTTRSRLQKTSQSRLWFIDGGAGPANAPEYQSYARSQGFTWPQGDRTPIRVPSEDNYGDFVILDQIVGQQGLPQLSIEVRSTRDLSEFFRLVRNQCPFDVQLHIGACRSPTDFDAGWEKILVLEAAQATEYSTGDLGALDRDQEAIVNETGPLTGLDAYEIGPIAGSETAESDLVNEAVAVEICDSRTCGECGIPSDGCQVVLIVAKAAGGSPGLPPQVLATGDGGATWETNVITTLPVNREPTDGTCVGTNFAVISNTDDAIHYAPIADLVEGTASFTEVTTGIVGAGSPNRIFSLGRTFTWIVGDGGYIYFSADITAGVTAQTAGSITAQNLNDIHGIDKLNLVAVGASNAVLVTANGGNTWSAVTGPAAGVVLNTVWMLSQDEWFIGAADGNLYYTRDAGVNWTAKAFSGSGSGSVRRIKFAKNSVGYMSHDTAAGVARIFRTINGGYSWYILPEAEGLSLPEADIYNDLAVCKENVNLVWGVGLAGDGTDGIAVKVA